MRSKDFNSNSFSDYFNEKMKNDSFREKWKNFEPEYKVMKAIAEARMKRELSQKELSVLSGIDQSERSKIESGNRNPSLKILFRLADAMDMELQIKLLPKKQ